MGEKEKNNPIVYVCRNRDYYTRMQSTSGGVFSALATDIIKRGGVVYGVIFDKQYKAVYSETESIEDLQAFRGSKYILANISCKIKDIEKSIESGRPVLVVGTPCQIAALVLSPKTSKSKNLLCVDFTCMGIGVPKIWEAYLKENFPVEKIKVIRFKDKNNGWRKFTTIIETENGRYEVRGSKNPYMRLYLERLIFNSACYQCRFKGSHNRYSDITISDAWGIEKFAPEMDDDKGASCVYINTNKGKAAFQSILKDIECKEIEFNDSIKENPYYGEIAKMPREREWYLKLFEKLGFNRSYRIYNLFRLKEKVKGFLKNI